MTIHHSIYIYNPTKVHVYICEAFVFLIQL